MPCVPKELHWKAEDGKVKGGMQKIKLVSTTGSRQAFKVMVTNIFEYYRWRNNNDVKTNVARNTQHLLPFVRGCAARQHALVARNDSLTTPPSANSHETFLDGKSESGVEPPTKKWKHEPSRANYMQGIDERQISVLSKPKIEMAPTFHCERHRSNAELAITAGSERIRGRMRSMNAGDNCDISDELLEHAMRNGKNETIPHPSALRIRDDESGCFPSLLRHEMITVSRASVQVALSANETGRTHVHNGITTASLCREVSYEQRSQTEEYNILFAFERNGFDEEDLWYLKNAFHEMQIGGSTNWYRKVQWVTPCESPFDGLHLVDVLPQSTGCARVRGYNKSTKILRSRDHAASRMEAIEMSKRLYHGTVMSGGTSMASIRKRGYVRLKKEQPNLGAFYQEGAYYMRSRMVAGFKIRGATGMHIGGAFRTLHHGRMGHETLAACAHFPSQEHQRDVFGCEGMFRKSGIQEEEDEMVVNKFVQSAREQRVNFRRSLALLRGSGCRGICMLKIPTKNMRVAPSQIHGFGLYTLERISPQEIIVEYTGEKIRSTVADERDRRCLREGITSSYLFRLDADTVIDARYMGSSARFVNHSCMPNCQSEIVTVRGEKKIFICAKKKISAGDEITYDYKFPIEDGNKINCSCGARFCRGTLN